MHDSLVATTATEEVVKKKKLTTTNVESDIDPDATFTTAAGDAFLPSSSTQNKMRVPVCQWLEGVLLSELLSTGSATPTRATDEAPLEPEEAALSGAAAQVLQSGSCAGSSAAFTIYFCNGTLLLDRVLAF